MRLTSRDLGEAYRAIADYKGIFAHLARFQDNGFHINPTNLEETAKKILDFINQCDVNPQYWQQISERAIQRVRNKYNWQLHTKQLLLCARIQGFWSYVNQENREAMLRYLEALFYLIYKPRAEKLLEQHMQR